MKLMMFPTSLVMFVTWQLFPVTWVIWIALSRNFRSKKATIAHLRFPLLALAEVYRQSDKYEERLQALMEATRLKPDDISLLNEIAANSGIRGYVGAGS